MTAMTIHLYLNENRVIFLFSVCFLMFFFLTQTTNCLFCSLSTHVHVRSLNVCLKERKEKETKFFLTHCQDLSPCIQYCMVVKVKRQIVWGRSLLWISEKKVWNVFYFDASRLLGILFIQSTELIKSHFCIFNLIKLRIFH